MGQKYEWIKRYVRCTLLSVCATLHVMKQKGDDEERGEEDEQELFVAGGAEEEEEVLCPAFCRSTSTSTSSSRQ